MSDQWLTYAAAATALDMTPESVRQRARREGWRRTIGNDGKARIMIPGDTGRTPADDPPGDAPVPRPRHRPEPDDAAHRARIADLQVIVADLRAAVERERLERLEERGRADRLTAEVATLARDLARVVEEAAARERELRERLATPAPRTNWLTGLLRRS